MLKNVKRPKRRFIGYDEEWVQKKWSDTVDISTEMVDPSSGEYDDMPHIAPGNIESFTGRILDNVQTVKEEKLISGKFRFRPGDVIYGKINPQLGKYFYACDDGLTSADAYVLNGKNGVTQKFLFSLLQTEDFFKYSVSVSMRSGMPKINREELNIYSYLSPNEHEQERIGNFLMELDNIINLHQMKYKKLQSLKKAYLSEMFPLPGEKRPRRRFAGFTGDWEQRKLDELCTFEKGRGLNKDDVDANGEYPCILYGELFTKYGMFIDSVISRTNNVQVEYKRSEIGDILIPRCDTTPDGLGRATSLSLENVILGFDINILKIKNRDNLDSKFVSVALNKHRKELLEKVVGNMVRHLENKEIKGIAIEYPHSIDEQRKIAHIFHQLENLIALHQRKLAKLQALKKAYLTEMFP